MNSGTYNRSRILRRSVLATALAAGLLGSGAVFAQATTGSIYGTAPAATGETVHVTGINGTSRTVSVDSSGRFSVSGLPVGSYTVTLMKDGQTLATQNNVTIHPGSGTEVPFSSGTPSEANAQNVGAVQVIASALPAIDVTSVNSSTVITAKELQELPVQRSAEAIALLAPNTVQGSGFFGNAVSFGGSSVAENAYYVNGYNTSEPYRNIGGFSLPYGAIEQQQTLTGGYSAKYGRSDGGVINQVGKRGTNEWHFGAMVSWAPVFWNAGGDNVLYPHQYIPGPVGGQPYTIASAQLEGTMYRYRQKNKSWQTIYSAYIGGPLIKDKLYVFAAVEEDKTHGENVQSIESGANGGLVDYYTNHTSKYYGKLDWNINDNNVLEATFLQSKTNGTSPFNGAGSTYNFDYNTKKVGSFVTANDQFVDNAKFLIARYTSYISDNATFNVLWGKGEFQDPVIYGNKSKLPFISRGYNQNPAYWPPGTPDTGIGNNQTNTTVIAPDASNATHGLRADFTYQLGPHELGVGIDNMYYAGHDQGIAMAGPGYYWRYLQNFQGNAYVAERRNIVFRTTMSLRQKAWYVQDVWQATSNLQLNLGLRNDRYTNYNNVGIAFVDEKNQWEPRLGFSWDVNGDSSFKIYGNAGRYYLALPDNAAERAANSSTYLLDFYTYSGIDSNGIPTGLKPIPGWTNYTPDGETGAPKDPKQVTAANLKPQYIDEYILGFDKQLTSKYTYGAKLMVRKLGTVIDDECSPGQIAAKMMANGAPASAFAPGGAYYDSLYGAAYCRLINPGMTNNMLIKNASSGDYVTVPMTSADWGWTNHPDVGKPRRKYDSLNLYIEHPFDGTWYGRIDYTYTYAKGNTAGQVRPDFGQNDVSKTEDWDSWQLMQGQYGELLNSRKHSLRFRGAYQITPEWLVSSTVVIQSGAPRECLGYFGPSASGDPTGYNSGGDGNYHWCAGQIVHPGSNNRLAGHTPWLHQWNLGVRYTPDFADKKLAFKLDVYNVLNEQNALQTDPTFAAGDHVVNNRFHQGVFFEPPRYVRLSVSYDY